MSETAPAAKALSFSLLEYRQRLNALRAALVESDLDALVVTTPENLLYMTGYRTPGYYAYQCAVITATADPILVTRHFEAENVRRYSWVDAVVDITDDLDPLDATAQVLVDLGVARGRVGVELGGWFLTGRQLNTLTGRLPDVDFVDGGDLVEQLRLIKTSAEIEFIRAACRVAEAGMEASLNVIDVGVSEATVAGAAMTGIVEAGGEYWSLPPFVCSGPRTGIPHATWSDRRIERGDVVYLELPGVVQRYGAGLMRSAVLGKPSSKAQGLAAVSLDGLEAAIEAIAPGVRASAVDQACRTVVDAGGYGAGFRHRTGYSIGTNFPPDWGEGHICHLKVGDETVLAPGMVFHLVPLIFAGADLGIGFSETVTVTDSGCEVLTRFPRELLIL